MSSFCGCVSTGIVKVAAGYGGRAQLWAGRDGEGGFFGHYETIQRISVFKNGTWDIFKNPDSLRLSSRYVWIRRPFGDGLVVID